MLPKSATFKVVIKPNAKKSEIIGYNCDKEGFEIAIKAPPKDNKANIELIKFLSKLLKKKVRIKSGKTSKVKVIEVKEN